MSKLTCNRCECRLRRNATDETLTRAVDLLACVCVYVFNGSVGGRWTLIDRPTTNATRTTRACLPTDGSISLGHCRSHRSAACCCCCSVCCCWHDAFTGKQTTIGHQKQTQRRRFKGPSTPAAVCRRRKQQVESSRQFVAVATDRQLVALRSTCGYDKLLV